MAEKTLNTIIQLRADTTENWKNSNVRLLSGEMGLEYLTDGTVKIKAGKTVTNETTGKPEGTLWKDLKYVGSDVKDAQVFQMATPEAYNSTRTDNQIITSLVNGATVQAGDVAIIKKYIAKDNTTKISYTSYVYENGVWEAMDGNYSAENVYFKEDLVTTTAIGNISLIGGQATISAKGQNLTEVFNNIFVSETNSGLKTGSPTCSININKNNIQYYEIGLTGSRNVTVSLNEDGSYLYGYTTENVSAGTKVADNTIVNDGTTGVAVDTSVDNPYKLILGSEEQTPTTTKGATFTLAPDAETDRAQLKVRGTVYYTAGKTPVSNLKKAYPAQAISAGSVSNTSKTDDDIVAFRWYVPYFYGFKYGTEALAAPNEITAAQVTALTKVKDADAYNKTKKTSATATGSWMQFFIAVPSGYGWEMSNAKDSNNLTLTVSKRTSNLSISINGTNVEYEVFYINNKAAYDTKTISWSL